MQISKYYHILFVYKLIVFTVNEPGAKLKGGYAGEGGGDDSPLQNIISQGKRIFAGRIVKFDMRTKAIIAKVYIVTVCHLVPLLVFELISFLLVYVISIMHLKIIPVSLQSLLLKGPVSVALDEYS